MELTRSAESAIARVACEPWREACDRSLRVLYAPSTGGVALVWEHEWSRPGVQVVAWRRKEGLSSSRQEAGIFVLQDGRASGTFLDHGVEQGATYFYRVELRRVARLSDLVRSYFFRSSLSGSWVYDAGVQFQCHVPDRDAEEVRAAEQDVTRRKLSKHRLELDKEIESLLLDSPQQVHERELLERELWLKYRPRLAQLEFQAFRQAILQRREEMERISAELKSGKIDPEEADILRDRLDLIARGDATEA